MAYINKNVSTMAMPSGMNRMGQFPLDMSSVYYDLDSLKAYATSGAVAYVGQILSLVNETDKTVTLYAIKNTDGDLVQIGTDIAIPEVEIPDITASDDDVIILTAEGHAVTASHAKKGPEGGAAKGATADAEVNAFGSSIEFKVPHVTVDEYGHTIALDEKTVKVSIPNAPVDNDTKTSVESGDNYIVVDGSLTENASNVFTVKINEATLKALIGSETTAAMEFKGATSSLPADAQKGDVYKVSATFMVDAENNAESDDVDPSGFITEIGDSIVAEGNGKWYLIPSGDDIEDTWRPVTSVDNDATLTFNAGEVLEVSVAATGEISYKHKEIAAPTETIDESGVRKYLTSITTDGHGHITGFSTATESVVNTDTNDTYSAGDGIEVSEADENSNHTVSVRLGADEEHLKFENGALVFDPTGINTDTNTTYSISANNTTITLTPSEGEAQEVILDVYTKGQTDQAIADKINEVNGGESAGEVLSNLNAYKKNIDTEIWGPEKVAEWTVEIDGKTNYSPDYTATSRIDTLVTELNSLTIDHIANLANELNNKINKTDVNNAQFEWINDQLNIKTIDSSLISGLDDLLNAKADASAIANLESLLDNKASVSSVSDLENALNNYKTTTDARLDALEEAMTWGEMSDTVE